MNERRVDPAYLRYQYDDAEKLQIRIDTHARYSERTGDTFKSWLLAHFGASAGQSLLDVGCGPGPYHAALAHAGVRVTGVDTSAGMLREVLAQVPPAGAVLASAERLPVRDALFDRVMANHMLYHVPDQVAALREMRRVVKSGGRVILATNGGDSYAHFDELHRAAAVRLGYAATQDESLRFALHDLPLVRGVFPSAEVFVREDAFVFTDPEPALRYYASGSIDSIEDRPADGSHRAPLLREMGDGVAAIIAREGVFRVAKSAGCFVATVHG